MKGDKHWANTWTEIEDLGGGKRGATISVGHQVFFDKADGNKSKKHKLTDNRPDHVVIQGAKCCVEVWPYYAKYFDVQHEEVRLHEERWVVQRLFKEPDTWRDVDAYNPVINVKEYSEPAGDVVKVTVTYDTDYGVLIVEYFQRDGNALKHNVSFTNTSGSTETFRVLQRWAGIVGAKCNGGDTPADIDALSLAFHNTDKPQKEFNIAESLWGMILNPDGSEKTDQCLKRPVRVEGHAQGMKADFIYGNWVLDISEMLTIDPATYTNSDPEEDDYIEWDTAVTYTKGGIDACDFGNQGFMGAVKLIWRSYVEWEISGIPDGSTITDVVFKYHGEINTAEQNSIIRAMAYQPTARTNQQIFDDIGVGTQYLTSNATFPEVGATKAVGTGGAVAWSDVASLKADLEAALAGDWFALGFQGATETYIGEAVYINSFYTEEKTDDANPKPTLYVTYSPAGWTGKISGVTNPAKIMGVDVANIAKVKGVA